MTPLNPQDPFPLRRPGTYTLDEAKAHARACDEWLGFAIDPIEAELARRGEAPRGKLAPDEAQAWIGLDPQALQTTYFEIRYFLEQVAPAPGQRIVDLGCAYARIAFVLARHHPGAEFVGYEFVPERVREARRVLTAHGLARAHVEEVDLESPATALEDADFYFLYDFGSRRAIDVTLEKLRAVAARHSIRVVARGRASRDAIERGHPWLAGVHAPTHYPSFSIYRT